MFKVPHFIWLAVCVVLLAMGIYYLLKYKPKLDNVLTICFIVAIISEVVKIFSSIKMIPHQNGNYYPYLSKGHLPFHLCSIQIIFISYVKFAKSSKVRDIFLAFMYPTCLLGAFIALLVPTIFINGTAEAYEPLAFQYFLFHVMLILLGLYIPLCKEVKITHKNYFTTIAILATLGFLSIYLNAALATVDFESNIYLDVTNFFFTYSVPIKLPLTEVWHWYLYLTVIISLVLILIGACYTPYFVKYFKNKKESLKEL